MPQRVHQIGSSLLLLPSFAFPVQQRIPRLDTFEDRSQVMRIRTELRIWWPKFHHLRPFPEIWEYRSHSESHCESHLSILSYSDLLLSFYRFYLGAQRDVFKDTGCWVDHLFEAALIPNGHEANVWPAVKSTEQKDSNVTWQKHSGKQVAGSCRKLLKPCTTCHLSSICHPEVSKSSGLAWLWPTKAIVLRGGAGFQPETDWKQERWESWAQRITTVQAKEMRSYTFLHFRKFKPQRAKWRQTPPWRVAPQFLEFPGTTTTTTLIENGWHMFAFGKTVHEQL